MKLHKTPSSSLDDVTDDILAKRQNPGSAIGTATGGGSPNEALTIALAAGLPTLVLLAGLFWWSHRKKKAMRKAGKEPPRSGWGRKRKGVVPKVRTGPGDAPAAQTEGTLAQTEDSPAREDDSGVRAEETGVRETPRVKVKRGLPRYA